MNQGDLTTLWRQQVSQRPHEVAFTEAGGTVTFSALNNLVERAACQLDEQNVQPGQAVIVNAIAGTRFVAAALAVRARHATLLPMDPRWPALFTNRILAIAAPVAALRDDGAPGFALPDVIPTTYDADCFQIICTSGSTGNPKAVLISEQAVLHRIRWFWAFDDNAQHCVFLVHKSPALVAAAPEYFQGLLAGQRSHVLFSGSAPRRDPQKIWAELHREGVTHAFATPSWWRYLNRAFASQGPLTQMKIATCSAEPLSTDLANELGKWLPNARILNLYGATECSSNAAFHEINSVPVSGSEVPIGKPIPGNSLRIVSKNGVPAADGVGELHVSGPCVALGYIGGEVISAAISGHGPEREFRTGDLARYDEWGNVLLCGRRDNTILHNGYSVIPEELEHTISALPGVDAVAVGHGERVTGPSTLCALLEVVAGTDLSVLRRSIAARVPSYLMPRLQIGSIPLTASGKIDRRALRRVLRTEEDFLAQGVQFNSEEDALDALRDYMGAPGAEGGENFFDLGGTSLTAVELVEAVYERTGVHIDLQEFFADTRLNALATLCWRVLQRRGASPNVVRPFDKQRYRCTPIQRSMLFAEHGANPASSNMMFAYLLPREVHIDQLAGAFERAVAAHPILTSRFDRVQQSAQISPSSAQEAWQGLRETDDVDGTLENMALRVMENGKYFLGGVLNDTSGGTTFWFLAHHAVFDGWSRSIFLGSLSDAYAGIPLTPEFGFLRAAHHSDRWLKSSDTEDSARFWKSILHGAPNRSAPDKQQPAGGSGYTTRLLPPDKLTCAYELSTRCNVSVHTALLTAFYAVLAASTHQRDLVIGLPIANRHARSSQQSIGCFMTPLPVRLQPEDITPVELAQHVHRSVTTAMTHARYPLPRIVGDLRQHPSQNPLFQCVFNVFERSWSDFKLLGSSVPERPMRRLSPPNELCVYLRLSPQQSELNVQYEPTSYREQFVASFCDRLVVAIEWLGKTDVRLSQLTAQLQEMGAEQRRATLTTRRPSRVEPQRRGS